ncbi:MAG: PorV/PorQ family protein [Ignavibacteria bacterium]
MFDRKIKIIFAVFMLILTSGIFAQEGVSKTGTTAAKFLSIGVGARANAMGGAYSSLANDATALYWNPAGIASINEYQTAFSHTSLFADINLNFVGFVIPLEEFGVVGLSVTALDYGEMEVTTEYYPEGTGETFTAGSFAFGLSYARNITEDFALGITAKYVNEDIYNSSASGFAFDIGTIFNTPFYGIKFASSITNYGTKMQMDGQDLLIQYDPDTQNSGNNESLDAYLSTDEFDLPLRLQIGLSKDIRFINGQRLSLAIDAAHPNDNNQWVNVGGELALINEMVFLRGGYKTLFLNDSQEGLTLGFGLNYSGLEFFRITIDYSYQQYEYLDNVHTFGVLLGF